MMKGITGPEVYAKLLQLYESQSESPAVEEDDTPGVEEDKEGDDSEDDDESRGGVLDTLIGLSRRKAPAAGVVVDERVSWNVVYAVSVGHESCCSALQKLTVSRFCRWERIQKEAGRQST